jgi:hypothetical protein
MNEIKPCPACENAEAHVTGYEKLGHWVACPSCVLTGPPKPSAAEAIAAWNALPRRDEGEIAWARRQITELQHRAIAAETAHESANKLLAQALTREVERQQAEIWTWTDPEADITYNVAFAINGPATICSIVTHRDGRTQVGVGSAVCAPSDAFDVATGRRLALRSACLWFNGQYTPRSRKLYDAWRKAQQPFKVGDRVIHRHKREWGIGVIEKIRHGCFAADFANARETVASLWTELPYRVRYQDCEYGAWNTAAENLLPAPTNGKAG